MPIVVAFTGVHTDKAQGIYMVTHRESSPLYNILTLPGNAGNRHLTVHFPLLCAVRTVHTVDTVQVCCGHHMALLPSFPDSELVAMWHVANPACICLAFCSPKHNFFHNIL